MTKDFETQLAELTPRVDRNLHRAILDRCLLRPASPADWPAKYLLLKPYLSVGVAGFLLGMVVMYGIMTGFFNDSSPGRASDTWIARNNTVPLILDDKTLDSLQRPIDLMTRLQPQPVESPVESQTPLISEPPYSQRMLMQSLLEKKI